MRILLGLLMMALGGILLIVHKSRTKSDKESTSLEKPYLRNAGIGFILFGIYYLVDYLF